MKFQKEFMDKFAEETTIKTLMDQIFSANMGPKEKVKDFNHSFTTILNMFQPDTKPSQELHIQVYANALPTSIFMFIKRDDKPTLDKNFEEAKIIKFQMKGCKYSQISLSRKETQQPSRRGFLLT
jgi:hypothetical protein